MVLDFSFAFGYFVGLTLDTIAGERDHVTIGVEPRQYANMTRRAHTQRATIRGPQDNTCRGWQLVRLRPDGTGNSNLTKSMPVIAVRVQLLTSAPLWASLTCPLFQYQLGLSKVQ